MRIEKQLRLAEQRLKNSTARLQKTQATGPDLPMWLAVTTTVLWTIALVYGAALMSGFYLKQNTKKGVNEMKREKTIVDQKPIVAMEWSTPPDNKYRMVARRSPLSGISKTAFQVDFELEYLDRDAMGNQVWMPEYEEPNTALKEMAKEIARRALKTGKNSDEVNR